MASPKDVGSHSDPYRPMDRFEWERIIRRLQIPSSVKYLALMVATYGDFDGTRVHPGVERLALVMCVSEKTVKRSLSELRELGLVERIKQGNRHAGMSDEYRLVVPADLMSRAMLDPDEKEMSAGHS